MVTWTKLLHTQTFCVLEFKDPLGSPVFMKSSREHYQHAFLNRAKFNMNPERYFITLCTPRGEAWFSLSLFLCKNLSPKGIINQNYKPVPKWNSLPWLWCVPFFPLCLFQQWSHAERFEEIHLNGVLGIISQSGNSFKQRGTLNRTN